MNYTHICSCL